MKIYLKKREYKGKEVEKRGKRRTFHLTLEEKHHFGTKGVGQEYPIMGKSTPIIFH